MHVAREIEDLLCLFENGFVSFKSDYVNATTIATKMTNNIFNYVAHDVLQYVLNPFLTADDRANFNAVVEPPERIAKKFPKNFAESHALRMAHKRQSLLAKRLNDIGREIDESSGENILVYFAERLGEYADFLVNPISRPLFAYRTTTRNKERMIENLLSQLDDENYVTPFLTSAVRAKILQAVEVIDAIVPEKHVPIKL